MKYVFYALVVLALLASVATASASAIPKADLSAWPGCTVGGGYGGWNQDPTTCYVVWSPACTGSYGVQSFTVGATGETTTMIHIVHLDGASDDSFNVMDGSNVVCSYADSTSTETWMTLDCNVNYEGEKTLTIQTTGLPGPYCVGYGQVAVSSITFDATPVVSVPEFGMVAGTIALIGVFAGAFIFRKR